MARFSDTSGVETPPETQKALVDSQGLSLDELVLLDERFSDGRHRPSCECTKCLDELFVKHRWHEPVQVGVDPVTWLRPKLS